MDKVMEELKAILRTTVGKVIAAVLAAIVAALGAIQTGVLELNPEDLNPVPVESQE
jgi:hypothetical protein